MIETIPQMRARHAKEIREAVEAQAAKRLTQTQASKCLGVSLTCLNNLILRMGIFWPVKAQGKATQ